MADEIKSVERSEVSHAAWRRWGGPAFVIGGLGVVALMLLILVAELGNQPMDTVLERFGTYLTVLIGLFLLVGLAGLYVRYGETVGAIGNTGIVLSALAAVLAVAAGVALVGNVESAWFVFFVAFVLVPAGMVLFGYATLRTNALPRWNALPLLIGLTPVIGLPLVFGLLPNTGAYAIVGAVVYLLAGVGWVLLGIVIRSGADDWAESSPSPSG